MHGKGPNHFTNDESLSTRKSEGQKISQPQLYGSCTVSISALDPFQFYFENGPGQVGGTLRKGSVGELCGRGLCERVEQGCCPYISGHLPFVSWQPRPPLIASYPAALANFAIAWSYSQRIASTECGLIRRLCLTFQYTGAVYVQYRPTHPTEENIVSDEAKSQRIHSIFQAHHELKPKTK